MTATKLIVTTAITRRIQNTRLKTTITIILLLSGKIKVH